MTTYEQYPGVAMYADISGYTPLAEELCARGVEGAEQLSQLLNHAFRVYLDVIYSASGSIAWVAGDALLAYWKCESDEYQHVLEKAMASAKQLHSSDLLHVPESLDMPRLHIGLAAGPIWAATLGGIDGHWSQLFAGAAVRQACHAATLSGPGETKIATDAKKLDEMRYEASSSRDPDTRMAQRLASFDDSNPVPEIFQKKIQKWDPQVRNVCALFVSIRGLDENAPNALAQHQSMAAALLETLRAYSGSHGRLMLDDKGLIFQLCLGIPDDTHADDELRIVRAGVAITSRLQELGLQAVAGVANGRGVCVPILDGHQVSYITVGRFMHLAARLMEHAGHGLLCTSELARTVQRELVFTEEESRQFKGIEQIVHPYRYEGEQKEVKKERIFGREEELGIIDTHLNLLEQDHGGIVSIVGDAGIGKSTVIRYVMQQAQSRRVPCLCGYARSVERSVSYIAWRPIFQALLEQSPLDSKKEMAEQFTVLLKEYPQKQFLPLINAVFPGLFDETPLTLSLSVESRVEATHNIFSQMIRQCVGERFVLIFEDIHWIDSASWRLVEHIARNFKEALFVFTSRPSGHEKDPEQLSESIECVELNMTALSRAAIHEIVRDLLPEGSIHSEIVDEIIQYSKGNSFFAREYTLQLISQQHFVRRHGEWRLRSLFSRHSFESLDGRMNNLLASRLDTLSRNAGFLLRVASVVGDQFSESFLRHIYPEASHGNKLRDMIEALVAQRLLIKIEQGDDRYHFQHALYRDCAYEQLTYTQRRELHERIARALEGFYSHELEQHFAELAFHWSEAKVWKSAVYYSDLAALAALRAGAYQEASRLLETCIRFADTIGQAEVDDERRMTWHRQRADAFFGLGQLIQRGEEVNSVFKIAKEPRPRNRLSLISQTLLRMIHNWVVRPTTDSQEKRDSQRSLEVAMAYRHSTAVCFFLNDRIGAFHDSVSAVYRAKSQPYSTVLASAYAELGMAIAFAGLAKSGKYLMQKGLETSEQIKDVGTLAYIHMLKCLYAVGAGEWGTAEQSATTCQNLCDLVHDHVNWANAETVRFWLNYYQGRVEIAHETANSLFARAKKTGNRQHRGWSLRLLSLSELLRGRPLEAVRQLEQALELLDKSTTLNERIPTVGSLALARLRIGDADGAYTMLQEGLALAEKVGRPLGHATLEGYSALAEVVFVLWQKNLHADSWKEKARRCLTNLWRYRRAFPIGEPRYRYWQGYFYLLNGHRFRARRSFRSGASAALKLGMPQEEVRCTQALKSQNVS